MRSTVTTVLELGGIAALNAAAFLAVLPFSLSGAFLVLGVLLLLSSAAIERWGA